MAKRKRTESIKPPELTKETSYIHIVAFWGIAIVLFMSPFFRGLFFPAEQYKALLFMALVFWLICLWRYKERHLSFFGVPLDYLVLALPLVYLVSCFNAVNTGTAVNEVLKNILYFMVFWSVSRVVGGREDAVRILTVVYMAALGVSLAGLMTATGVIYIDAGFLNGRIYSFLQYPNALASYLAAALFMGLYLWQSDGKAYFRNYNVLRPYIYTFCTYIICTVLVGTRSNGGLLVFVLMLAVYFLFIKGSDKLRVLSHLLSAFVPGAIAAILFLKSALNNAPGKAWLFILAGAALAVALQYIIDRLTMAGMWDKLWRRKTILVCCGAVLIIILGLVAYQYVATHTETVTKVLADMRLRNATERTYFYSDALKMVKERPVIGWGGGGWQEAYRYYQGYLYSSTQVHSYYLQVLVETGAVGLAVVLGIWGMFLFLAHRLYHKTFTAYPERLLIATIAVSALTIGGHAVIDFDLSLSALAMVLFALFGVTVGLYRGAVESRGGKESDKKNKDKYRVKGYISVAAVSLSCLAVILIAGSFSSAEGDVKDAGAALNKGDVKTATAFLETATKNNPFSVDNNMRLADLYARQGMLNQSVDQVETALRKSKYNPSIDAFLSSLYLNTNKPDEAVSMAEKALTLAPYQISWYDNLSRTYFFAGYSLMEKGNKTEADQMLAKATRVDERINSQAGKVGPVEKELWNVAPMLAPSDVTRLYAGSSYCLLGEYQKADPLLKAVSGDNVKKAESLLWQGYIAKGQGNTASLNEFIAQAKKLAPDAEKQFAYVFNLINK